MGTNRIFYVQVEIGCIGISSLSRYKAGAAVVLWIEEALEFNARHSGQEIHPDNF